MLRYKKHLLVDLIEFIQQLEVVNNNDNSVATINQTN